MLSDSRNLTDQFSVAVLSLNCFCTYLNHLFHMKGERWKNNSSSPNKLFSTYLIEDRCRRSFHNITFKIAVTLSIKLTLFRMFTINIKITIFIQLAGLKAFLNICKRCNFHLYWIQLAKFFSENLKQIYLDMMVFNTFLKCNLTEQSLAGLAQTSGSSVLNPPTI